jgi:hypothetical protein
VWEWVWCCQFSHSISNSRWPSEWEEKKYETSKKQKSLTEINQ